MESSSSYAAPVLIQPIAGHTAKTSTLEHEIAATIALTSATPGMVAVIAADPGAGKSFFARSAIADQVNSGSCTRVIYVVPDTIKETSLGAEALKHFTDLGVNASIVYGQEEAKRRGVDYNSQFVWGSRNVLIVPQAHLVLLEKSKIIGDLFRGANFVVCDEDASRTLLQTHEFKVSLLPDHPLTKRLGNGNHQRKDQPGDASWVNRDYFGDIVNIIVPDGEISKLLKVTRTTVQELVGSAQAVNKTDQGRHAEDAKQLLETALTAGKYNVQLRYEPPLELRAGELSVSVAIQTHLPSFMPPVVFLDAFATKEKSEAVLGRPVDFRNLRSGRLPKINTLILHGSSYKKVALDVIVRKRRNGQSNEGRAILVFTALTIVRQMDKLRPLTLVGFRDHLEPLIAEIKRIFKIFYRVTPNVEPFHFYAGRGVNSHTGRDIIALMAPYSNMEESLLIAGAVYPEADQTDLRAEFSLRLVEEEFHQTLHRARPLQNPDVSLTAINPSRFADNDELAEFQPPHWQHNNRQHSHDHVRDELALWLFRGLKELIVALGAGSPLAAGIPLAVLATARMTEDLQTQGDKYRELLREALDLSGDLALRQHWVAKWLIDGEYPEARLPRALLSPWKSMQADARKQLALWLSSELGMRSAIDASIVLMPSVAPSRGQSLLDKIKPLGAARGGRRI